MGNKLKDTDIENCTYYSFDDMISIKDLDPNKIKIDQKSYKNFLIFYMTVQDLRYVQSNSVNSIMEIHIWR